MGNKGGGDLPLTAAQLRVWFAQRMEADNPCYRAAEVVEIQGPVDLVLLEQALRQAVADTEMLRVRFETDEEGRVRQVVEACSDWPLPVLDMRDAPQAAAAAQAWMRRDLEKPVDLRRSRAFSFTAFRTASDRVLLYAAIHHAVADGYSFALFLTRAAEVYTSLETGRPVPPSHLGPLSRALADEADYHASPALIRDRDYWAGRLADWPRAAHAPRLWARPGRTFTRVTGHLAAEAADRMRQAARTARTSLPCAAMAALALYVGRLGDREEAVLDVTLAGRGPGSRDVPVMLANVLPLRVPLSRAETWADLLHRTAEEAKGLLRHQRYPAGHLSQELKIVRPCDGPYDDWGVNIMTHDARLSFGRHRAVLHNLSNGPVTGMSVNVYDRPADGSLRIDLQAAPDTYPPAEVAAHHRRFLALLHTLAETDIGGRLQDVELVTGEERQRLLAAGCGTARPRAARLLHTAFEAQAGAEPQVTALVCGRSRLTRGELNTRANQLARLLVERGAAAEEYVAIALARTADYPVAVLAVLKSGAACLPLDVTHPPARIRGMLEAARPVCVLATTDTAARLPCGDRVLLVDTPESARALAAQPTEDLSDRERRRVPRPHHAAYLAHTSGTTGRPKGVVVEHRHLANLLADHTDTLIAPAVEAAGHRLRSALTASFCFDTSWEGWLFLAAGQEVHLIEDEVRHDPAALVEYVTSHHVDFLDVTPSYLQQLLAADLFKGDRHHPGMLMVGGEPLAPALWRQLRELPGTAAYNYYGPTEVTVDAVYCRLREQGEQPVIGRPGQNVRAYVLDRHLHPVPPQVAGELYLGGDQVARGYLHQPDLTAERFLPDPFGAPGDRMYRTGDRARWTDGQVLEYLGRVDGQLKINGVRVEPGEIETTLTGHPDVAQAAVTAQVNERGESQLTAHVVPAARPSRAGGTGRAACDPAALRAWAASHLPAATVPTAFVLHDALPLTAQGKLDYAALPTPAAPVKGSGRAARTTTETALCELFAQVLDVPEVGVDDDFFALGGHSLPAARLITRIRSRLGVDLPLQSLYQAPTVAALSPLLDAGAQPDTYAMLLPLRPAGSRPPVFCVHPAGGLGWCYATFPSHLPPDVPLYALQAQGLDPADRPAATFTELIASYVAAMRSVQETGPYHLLGWSLGGALAHAVAVRLQEQGERVQLLAMLDSEPLDATVLPAQALEPLVRKLLLEAAGLAAQPPGQAEPTSVAPGGPLPHPSDVLAEEQVSAATATFRRYSALLPTRTSAVFAGDLLYFRAARETTSRESASRLWRPWVTGRITSYDIECDHAAMTQPAHAANIGRLLTARLRADAP
ncbi:amino acid adenylation domain-containing protein [Streptomyces sp. NPDC049577]|uniref:amino acid adenylation domain-containing protein n=1 Tax=Streptomyces sp. NPDC049577 TaxID=3155153 RepID=UPI0034363084